MKRMSRWMMAILAVLGLHTATAQAKNQPTHHANALDLAPLHQTGGGTSDSDGSTAP